ncbi:MAG: response regulator [Spirochaetota bacterium]|nr:response regulator [Spirochaetota bacterium]
MAKILVIEDSHFQHMIINNILTSDGHEIYNAFDGNEGLKIILNQKIDCVLMDLSMPNFTGQELLKTLKEKNIKIPVIVVTADIQDSSKNQCMEMGARAYITKPVNKNELIKIIKETLGS